MRNRIYLTKERARQDEAQEDQGQWRFADQTLPWSISQTE